MNKIILAVILLVSSMTIGSTSNYGINYLEYETSSMIMTEREQKVQVAKDIIMESQHNGCRKRHCWTDNEAEYLAGIIYDNAEEHDLSYPFLLTIMRIESNFYHNNVRSSANAIGIMQTIPSTFVGIAKKHGYDYDIEDAYDLEKNIQVGCLFIKDLKEKHKRNDYVIVGYNWSPSKISVYKRYRNGDDVDIPSETKKYLAKYNKFYYNYKKRLGE